MFLSETQLQILKLLRAGERDTPEIAAAIREPDHLVRGALNQLRQQRLVSRHFESMRLVWTLTDGGWRL